MTGVWLGVPFEAKQFPQSAIHGIDHRAKILAMAIRLAHHPPRLTMAMSSSLKISMAIQV